MVLVFSVKLIFIYFVFVMFIMWILFFFLVVGWVLKLGGLKLILLFVIGVFCVLMFLKLYKFLFIKWEGVIFCNVLNIDLICFGNCLF